jgi:hypothetical protein
MQNSVCGNTDAALFERLAKMTITKSDYRSLKLIDHTQLLMRWESWHYEKDCLCQT